MVAEVFTYFLLRYVVERKDGGDLQRWYRVNKSLCALDDYNTES
jgi:hypothetical protein